MTIGRNFWKLTRWARALRFWLFLLFAALAWFGFGVGEARAQDTSQCENLDNYGDGIVPYCGTLQAAYDVINQFVAMAETVHLPARHLGGLCGGGSNVIGVQAQLRIGGSNRNVCRRALSGCPAGEEWFGGTFSRCDTTCESRPTAVTLFAPANGSIGCARGCMRSYMANGDNETMTTQSTGQRCEGRPSDCSAIPAERGNFFFNNNLNVCEPVVPQCAEGQKLEAGKCVAEDFCPVGMIVNEMNICEPREGECPAGSTRSLEGMCVAEEDDGEAGSCPGGLVRGSDGTCKPDADDDGVADDDDGKFSGGDSCDVPPTCSGDSIMCGQARIQWRIDCNTRRNQKISGGGCAPNTMPLCVGESCDLMEYGQLVQQWGARCAMEKLADGLLNEGDGGGGVGEGDGKDPDFDPYAEGQAAAGAEDDGGVEPDDIFTDESANNDGAGGVPGGTGELDTSGLGFSRGCVALPVIQVMGVTLDFAGPGNPLCDWMRLGGQFVLIIAALISVRIIGGGAYI